MHNLLLTMQNSGISVNKNAMENAKIQTGKKICRGPKLHCAAAQEWTGPEADVGVGVRQ